MLPLVQHFLFCSIIFRLFYNKENRCPNNKRSEYSQFVEFACQQTPSFYSAFRVTEKRITDSQCTTKSLTLRLEMNCSIVGGSYSSTSDLGTRNVPKSNKLPTSKQSPSKRPPTRSSYWPKSLDVRRAV